jgi:hypothetical protein
MRLIILTGSGRAISLAGETPNHLQKKFDDFRVGSKV